ncbi:hypothetical protein HMPREF0305_12147 [Corynebacterium pseudogenitalium ATCC 33035]|uniref:Uncharacterized protein n=1 Tax=Corynebacterium pseudogenitalium ATCC 33035 TaxID=525264 RepID=E2S6J5_9CORY|nr:hypothetical protein HMPREF0305_12147 [Corynebacterium pseudogenitalium ATCC 33035]
MVITLGLVITHFLLVDGDTSLLNHVRERCTPAQIVGIASR